MRQVFLSSTARDLAQHRQAVYDLIESLDGYHCIRMENFGARDAAAVDFDRSRIEQCDLFVGLIGTFHGSTPRGEERSFTELEFEAAVALEKPRLMFLTADDSHAQPALTETDEHRRRQALFRHGVATDRVCGMFTTPPELAGKVIAALFNWEAEHGGAPGGRASNPKWLPVPRPPTPHLAHSYPLQDHFTGRLHERHMLSNWLGQDPHPLLILVGIGGLGKSALAWVWLQADVRDVPIPGVDPPPTKGGAISKLAESSRPEGVLWWSFYESESTFTAFLNEAIVYVSEGLIDPDRIPSVYARARTLFGLLQRKRFLVVLDGFERLLRAYSGLSGGLEDGGQEITDDRSGHHSMCADPIVSKFLVWVASSPIQGRFLVTSRLFPKELEGFGGMPLAGSRREDLNSLDPEDAVAFFHAMGVRGSRWEIKSACAPYGYHALALRLLCGYIVNHVAQPGDIQVALHYDPTKELVPQHHHILNLAFDALGLDERRLLSRIAAFRSEVDFEGINAIGGLEIAALERALRDLISRGLVFFNRSRVRYDLHPIVRRYAYDRLTDKPTIHSRLRDYFAAVPEPDLNVRRVEELFPVIELFYHTIGAGRFDEAFKLYRDRLDAPLTLLGAYQTGVELLEFFMKGNGITHKLIERADRATVLNRLGIYYEYMGRPRHALKILHDCISIDDDPIMNILNICYSNIQLGELAEAETILRQRITMLPESNYYGSGYAHTRLGLLLSYCGRFDEAVEEFRAARSLFWKNSDLRGEFQVWNYRVVRALMIGESRLAFVCACRSLHLAESFHQERELIRSKSSLASVLLELSATDLKRSGACLAEAEMLLIEALIRCRQLDLTEIEPGILLNWARWHRLKGNLVQSLQDAVEALAIADRCEYRLEQAEIRNHLARLALDERDTERARYHATVAQERAWCDGPPHTYKSALEEAERLLANLDSWDHKIHPRMHLTD